MKDNYKPQRDQLHKVLTGMYENEAVFVLTSVIAGIIGGIPEEDGKHYIETINHVLNEVLEKTQ